MRMANYTVAIGYGRVGDTTDAQEIVVRAGTAAAAICVATMQYVQTYGQEFPEDDVVYAEVVAVRAAKAQPARRRRSAAK